MVTVWDPVTLTTSCEARLFGLYETLSCAQTSPHHLDVEGHGSVKRKGIPFTSVHVCKTHMEIRTLALHIVPGLGTMSGWALLRTCCLVTNILAQEGHSDPGQGCFIHPLTLAR